MAEPQASGSSMDEVIALYKRDVDRSLLREALRMTPDERLRRLVELTAAADKLREAALKEERDR
jgi:hypothetical protein